MKIFTFLSLWFVGYVLSVPFTINPGCDLDECKESLIPSIFYSKADLVNSSIHVIFSSFDQLTISVIETKHGENVKINYSEIFSGNYSNSISFVDSHPLNVISVVVRRLIEFNDLQDEGEIDPLDNTTIFYSLSNAKANQTSFPDAKTDEPTFKIPLNGTNGTLTVEIIYPGETFRDSDFPKLQVLSKSFFLNMILEMNELKFEKSRFLFELDFYSFGAENFTVDKSSFIDDQYTPGIFNVYQMKSLSPLYDFSMLWKPVAYLTDERSIEANTLMEIYDLKNHVIRNDSIDRGIVDAFYIQKQIASLNISVGHSGDGFFTANNYSFIQFAIGAEDLPVDSTSMFVTVSVIGSFALPVLVGFAAFFVILKRRCSRRANDGYESISN